MYTVTINIAGRGTSLLNNGTGNPGQSSVGHMWYELNDGNKSESYGFAPIKHGSPLTPGDVYRNDSSNYQSRAYTQTIEISKEQYDAMRDFGNNPTQYRFDKFYDGADNSCIDFTWKALEIGGLNPLMYEGFYWPTWNMMAADILTSGFLSFDKWAKHFQEITEELNPLWSNSIGHWIGQNAPLYDEVIENVKQQVTSAKSTSSPIILDLNNNGVETTGVKQGAYFDHANDGFAEQSGWVGASDGIIYNKAYLRQYAT